MGNLFNSDFQEFLQIINRNDVDYILVGGYSVVIHGYPRTTGDMDIWVDQTASNYDKIRESFAEFGLPIMSMTDFLNEENDVFSYGRPPVAIVVMTKCKGLDFDAVFEGSSMIDIEGVMIRVISYEHLIQAKKAAGRFKDLNDIEHLSPPEEE